MNRITRISPASRRCHPMNTGLTHATSVTNTTAPAAIRREKPAVTETARTAIEAMTTVAGRNVREGASGRLKLLICLGGAALRCVSRRDLDRLARAGPWSEVLEQEREAHRGEHDR